MIANAGKLVQNGKYFLFYINNTLVVFNGTSYNYYLFAILSHWSSFRISSLYFVHIIASFNLIRLVILYWITCSLKMDTQHVSNTIILYLEYYYTAERIYIHSSALLYNCVYAISSLVHFGYSYASCLLFTYNLIILHLYIIVLSIKYVTFLFYSEKWNIKMNPSLPFH